MISSKTLLAGTVVALLAQCNTASAADTRVQASSGVQYSDGKYGETTSTSAIVVPFSVRASFGSWSIRASVPFVTVDGLRMAKKRMFFNDAKARRELGYASRPYREGLADAIDWFKAAGYLR